MTNLGPALNDYASAVLGAVGTLAIVAAVGLACILLLWGWLRS